MGDPEVCVRAMGRDGGSNDGLALFVCAVVVAVTAAAAVVVVVVVVGRGWRQRSAKER